MIAVLTASTPVVRRPARAGATDEPSATAGSSPCRDIRHWIREPQLIVWGLLSPSCS